MSEQVTTEAGSRLAPQASEVIDRDAAFSFTFNGKRYTAHPGDTIGSALAAAGVRVLSRSFKYHRPRGLMCCAGHCPNCLVAVGKEPNVRACTRPVEPEMVVRPQNVWPSLDYDLMSLTRLASRFLPVGFYYKTFIRPQALWPTYESVLRRSAGLGKVYPEAVEADFDKQYLHAEVVVVGGGPAGLSAATAAAAQGARVLLFDDNESLGGHLRFGGADDAAALAELLAAAAGAENLTTYSAATVLGRYEQNWLSAVQGQRLYKIRAGTIILATGAYEQPLIFDNNDLPGVMLGSAVQRLLHLYAVAPGRRAVVVTANDDGWQVAADLQAAGVEVAAVADQRQGGPQPLVDQLLVEAVTGRGATAFWQHTILSADGGGGVKRATIAPLAGQGEVDRNNSQAFDCDLLVISVGWAPANGLFYQAGGKVAYDGQRAEFLPDLAGDSLPDGIFVAGRLAGSHALAAELRGGRAAGRRAAARAGFAAAAGAPDDQPEEGAPPPPRSSSLVKVPGDKKRFICFCEDVTDKDLDMAIAEGYNSIELLKRYSTISMGPCQGKMCSFNTIHLCARANDWTIEQTGTTTARPPLTPVKLGALAGQHMEPERVSAVHEWHVARGAKMMVAGLWLRPEHYGDPLAEVEAVRQRAGLIDISTLGKLRLTGAGVPDLLDRIYVNKWQKLAVGRVRYGLMCNDEGIILDDGVTAHVADREWYMTTTSSGAASIYEWLQWWMQSGWGEGAHLTSLTEVNAAFNLAGPQSRAILQRLTDGDVSHEAFPYMSVRQLDLAGVTCRLMRIGFTGELSYEIHCPSALGLAVWQALIAAGEEFGILPFGVEAQRVLRLEKGHVIVGQDTDALSNPIAADMSWAVKLDKEDFLGRRPLARAAEAGPAQRLVGFKMVDAHLVPDEGLQIVRSGGDGVQEIIGWVTSSRFSPTLDQAIGLCWLPAGVAAQAGAEFTIRMNGKLAPARVHHGAFYDPEGARLRT